ncbi:MAG: extracellular solute-binding protein [Hydrococcus sp. RU_2_2]|nr:extracellular solute-binding protein [Hydrococcus sp. RU_2_2]
MNRRSLLSSAGLLMLSQFLASCGQANTSLRIRLLEDSVPAQILREFQRRMAQGKMPNFLKSNQVADLFARLQTWKESENSSRVDDLVMLGDYWLGEAIRQELIQPFDVAEVNGWQRLPPYWETVVKRDRQGQPSQSGEFWAAPYRWGTLVIAYNLEQFQSQGLSLPIDWSDLWRSEVKGQISLPDSPRSVIGLVLKRLGQSINIDNPKAVVDLEAELETLQSQVKFYSSDAYLQPLLLGDTWMAVGWSTEVLPVVEKDHRIAAIIPKAGTILTADLWVRPKTAPAASIDPNRAKLLKQWLEFCWELSIATQMSLLSSVTSAIFLGSDRTQAPDSLQQNALLLPPTEILESSEFLLPLSATATDQYRQLWTEIRRLV